MSQIKAAVYTEYGLPKDVLAIKTVDRPKPGPKEVLLKTYSVGVNPVAWKLMGGHIQSWPHTEGPFIPSWDIAGKIEAVGAEVKEDLKVGDEVYSYHRPEFDADPSDRIGANGCLAEYVSIPSHRVARKPKKASFQQAAAIPLAGLTAFQAIHDYLKLPKTECKATVLVTGGSGGVGGFGILFAKAAGATVIATCSASNSEYVKKLGADVVIDYKKGAVDEQVRKLHPEGVDYCFDSVADKDAVKAVKKGGAICSVANWSVPKEAEEVGVTGTAFLVKPNAKQLAEIAALFDAGKAAAFKVTVLKGFDKAVQAFETSMAGRTVGKLVLQLAE